MTRKRLYLAIGAGVLVYFLLRRKSTATAAASPALGGFTPISVAQTYFDPGQDFTVNANVNSSSFGVPLNVQ